MIKICPTPLGLAVALALPVFVMDIGQARADDYARHAPLRYGVTSPWWTFDARNDSRDVPTNGVFPGNFAANPPVASIGAAGWLESNPYRSPAPYPSQVYFGAPGEPGRCAEHRRNRARTTRHHHGGEGACSLFAR